MQDTKTIDRPTCPDQAYIAARRGVAAGTRNNPNKKEQPKFNQLALGLQVASKKVFEVGLEGPTTF